MEINIDNIPDAADAAVHLSADMPDVAMLAVSIGGASILLFVLFVLPVWLLLHYRSRSRHLPLPLPPPPPAPARSISMDELNELARLAERIESRLDAVETLMDADTPNWRR